MSEVFIAVLYTRLCSSALLLHIHVVAFRQCTRAIHLCTEKVFTLDKQWCLQKCKHVFEYSVACISACRRTLQTKRTTLSLSPSNYCERRNCFDDRFCQYGVCMYDTYMEAWSLA